MNIDKVNTPVLVTGIERSGASMVARIISLCGVFTGDVSNMRENVKIKDLVNKYYKFIHVDVKGQCPVPDTNQLIWPSDWRDKIIDVINEEGYKNNKSWMYKEARICQIWPIWNHAFPNAKWIIVRRRTGDIIESCLKTGYMTAYNNKDGWLDWVHHHETLFIEMIRSGLNCKIVWPERMANDDFTQMIEMIEWLGLKWNDKIEGLIKPLLQKSKQKTKEG
jgi:hypothetical protein